MNMGTNINIIMLLRAACINTGKRNSHTNH